MHLSKRRRQESAQEVKDVDKTYAKFVCSLRRQHHLLWLLLGVGFSLFLCSQLAQEGHNSIGLMMGLLVTYRFAGQLAARLVARSVSRSTISNSSAALFSSSAKIGAFFSVLSILFHLALLVTLESKVSFELLLHMREPILLRAAIFPFLACLGAACTASSVALNEPTTVVHLQTESDSTALSK